jgi:hypothetical protein
LDEEMALMKILSMKKKGMIKGRMREKHFE